MRTRSANFIMNMYSGQGIHDESMSLITLYQLRYTFLKKGLTIKWYKTKTGYSVYFRSNYKRKPKVQAVPVVDLQLPVFNTIESMFTPEQVNEAFA